MYCTGHYQNEADLRVLEETPLALEHSPFLALNNTVLVLDLIAIYQAR